MTTDVILMVGTAFSAVPFLFVAVSAARTTKDAPFFLGDRTFPSSPSSSSSSLFVSSLLPLLFRPTNAVAGSHRAQCGVWCTTGGAGMRLVTSAHASQHRRGYRVFEKSAVLVENVASTVHRILRRCTSTDPRPKIGRDRPWRRARAWRRADWPGEVPREEPRTIRGAPRTPGRAPRCARRRRRPHHRVVPTRPVPGPRADWQCPR